MTPAPLPPGPKGGWLTGCLSALRRDILGFFTELSQNYGDVVPFRIGLRRCVLLNRPDLIEDVLLRQSDNFVKHFGLRINKDLFGEDLLVSEGQGWLRQRRMASPAFRPKAIAGYARTIVECTARAADSWRPGEVRDIGADMVRLTLDIAARTLFGDDLSDAEARRIGDGLEAFMENYTERLFRLIPWPSWFPSPSNLRAKRAIRQLNGMIRDIIARRRAAPDREGRTDLLALLLAARDDDGSSMDDALLVNQARTMLTAGHETTAIALSWTWHLLSRNPESAARLARESDRVLGDRPPAHEDIPRLTYAAAVVNEAMRLYPPAYVLGREAIADCVIGGYAIPAGTTLFMAQWVTHRDPRWFADPERFDPDRWTGGSADRLPRFAYYPFGGGPRVCIGNIFAMTELVLVVGDLARRFRFEPADADPVLPRPSLTLRPDRPIRVRLAGRTTANAEPAVSGRGEPERRATATAPHPCPLPRE